MSLILTAIEAVLSVIVTALILIQQRSADISATFGGTNTVQVQRRGAEKILYQATVICATTLIVLSIAQWYTA